ncbi:MAG: type 4a pilus biogenesis protein PilO [Candidatus Levybacteria bacterium]|nr:type 4a pilus biogenesis protein PilO [Candidatus Levybacteria bacterium]MBI2190028.1 type 4a pilus biogenesis protein PilO [Candidatus Levybacteria bacterium]MBI2622652.1 type 4a pilus biogenesis protein PilO [Candidatus Levybacteria bacterium]MBI3070383.1 type 4a pilus biogenesis protein PilO [Candidatus Levybacteria bacterium]MBI3092798.1 type 4a pilus biogenesis protein PilO [Candidatus Levybacteria bacterium]
MLLGKKVFANLSKNKYWEMLPNLKEEKAKNFTTLILTLLALSFFGFFAISPTLSTIAQLKREIADNEFVDQRLGEKIQNLSLLQKEYSLLEKDLPAVFSAVPQSPNTPLLVGQIQFLALQSSLSITRLQVFQVELSQKTDKSGSSSFAFSLGAQGTTPQLTNFLNSLLRFERVITVENISFTKGSDKEEMLKLDLKGKAYFKK